MTIATQLNYSLMSNQEEEKELKPTLIFLNGDMLATPIPLNREEIILGRTLAAHVRINDSKIAKQHAKIITKTDKITNKTVYTLINIGSKSETFLNGKKITSAILKSGDKIILGSHTVRFDLLDEIDHEYHHQIRRLIAHDDLTGLLSSRSFFSELKRESFTALKQGMSFCVLMMDIDHFKLVNDNYGHLTGSKTIEEIGQCINESLRSGDVGARFGGEEFSAFLMDAGLEDGLIAAERIRKVIEEKCFTVIRHKESGSTHHITISIGISCFPTDSTDPIELVEMADSALYRAKSEGRNKVCVYEP